MINNAVRAARPKKSEDSVLWDDGSGRREDKKEDRLPIAARLPKSLHDYVTDRAGKRRGEITRVLEEMIRLHRQLFERLAADRIRIQRFALDENLSWPGQAAEVFARLMLRGLEDAERRRK